VRRHKAASQHKLEKKVTTLLEKRERSRKGLEKKAARKKTPWVREKYRVAGAFKKKRGSFWNQEKAKGETLFSRRERRNSDK